MNPHPTEGFALIALFLDEIEAHLAVGALHGAGIDAFIENRMPRHAIGNRKCILYVPVDQATEAREILQGTPARAHLVDPARRL